jgi:hypothetical protein
MEHLQNWVFHYNTYTSQWAAIPRDLYNEYWSDYSIPEILRSSNIETLISLVSKHKGDVDKLKEL